MRIVSLSAACVLALAAAFASISCVSGDGPAAPTGEAPVPVPPWPAGAREAACSLAGSLSVEELAGQVLMVGVDGMGVLPVQSGRLLEDVRPGAVILFGFNVPDDLSALAGAIEAMKAAASVRGMPPFVAIDHEGGDVFRFRTGLTPLPSARTMGAAGTGAARAAGHAAGSELGALGITLNLAPVVEALDERNGAFLAGRSWSTDPLAAAGLSSAFIEACQSAGTAATAKHYPGNAAEDPHEFLPILYAPVGELAERFYPPFAAASRSGVACVMLSHAVARALDPDNPATLSAAVIDSLKRGIGFEGFVLTDDLTMAALSGSGGIADAAVRALAAGADMVMVSGGPGVLAVRDGIVLAAGGPDLPIERLREAAARVLAQKFRFGLPDRGPGSADGLGALVQENDRILTEALAAGG